MLDTIKGGMKTKFLLIPQVDQGFETLKKKIAQLSTLVLPIFDQLFQVECDASNVGIGAILSQEGRSISFQNEKINDANRIYSSYDLEIYTLVQALRKSRHYFLPKEFVVHLENQALIFLNSRDKVNNKHMKQVEYLQAYTFTIKRKKGVENKVADVLSRRLLTVQEIQL